MNAVSEPRQALPGSFRDPQGVVFRCAGELYRQINPCGMPDYKRLMQSGLYGALVKRRMLVAHEQLAPPQGSAAESALIKPVPIPFISFPYEWSFSQLRDAALLTLAIQELALEHGMVLRDASAYNIQFAGGAPVLIDTLSFGAYEEGRPWQAYRQFCQHFLAPLALMAGRDVRLLQMMRTHIDGIPLDLASALLPARSWLRPGLLMHLHLHAKAQGAYADGGARRSSAGAARPLSRNGMLGIIGSLRSTIAGLDWTPAGTEWADYYQQINYTDAAFQRKREIVSAFLDQAAPRAVWDLGANTGVFSRLASERGIATVAFDIDPAAVERNYRIARGSGETMLLPLVMDLTNPSPALGWANAERPSLGERAGADCVMALALIHHMAISNNVPLAAAARYFAALGKHLIIEFVPKSDSQVRKLLSSRADIFDEYDEAGFERAFQLSYNLLRKVAVEGTGRILYLWERSGPAASGQATEDL